MLTAGLYQCALGLPFVLVWLVAGVMIAQRIENHRSAASVALAGIAVGVLELAAGAFGSMYAPFLVQQGMSVQNIGLVLSLIGIGRTIVGAISWGLVLAALVMALGKRDTPVEV
jgi:hypothetical protein